MGMRIASITAGAAGMYCGSCLRDNTLAAALNALGHDAILVPTFTPIRTDEIDVSNGEVFYGGINVYLQEKSSLFRHSPRWLDWLLNRPGLIRFATKRSFTTDYAAFADLTLSMLKGKDGRQRKELAKLVDWLKADHKPDVVILTNALLSGLVPSLKQDLGVPVLTTLQGDDIFLDALPGEARRKCIAEIRRNDAFTDGYLCTSQYYADYMSEYLGVDRQKMDVVYPGLKLAGHGVPHTIVERPLTMGYFARICTEKGFHQAVDAFLQLKQKLPTVRFLASGWLGRQNQAFFEEQVKKIHEARFFADFEYVDCPDHARKVKFFQSIDVLTVPTTYREPKGLYVLEAWANGVPVVQPRHGSFPELIEATTGGRLFEPGNIPELAGQLQQLLTDAPERTRLGQQAQAVVRDRFTAQTMATETLAVLEKYVKHAVHHDAPG